jgi:hypothetical protein
MKRAAFLLALAFALCNAPADAQSAGKTGAQVLQFNAGSRAAAMAGAYTAATSDADALFYNPAGMATVRKAASASYETHSLDIAYGSAAGLIRFGRVNIGTSVAYLDAGSINEITPDPEFGGNTGIGTGNTVSASESAARISIGAAFNQLRAGASVGFVSSTVADASSQMVGLSAGLQYDVAGMTLGAVLRDVGGSDLPTEARLGVSRTFMNDKNIGATFNADAIARVREGSFSAVGGLEVGILPGNANDFGAVARIGYDAEPGNLAPLRFGAGITMKSVSLDYAFQNLDFAGVVHRIGVRWATR